MPEKKRKLKKAKAKLPTDIGDVQLTLIDLGHKRIINYQIHVVDEDGEITETQQGDFTTFLTDAQIAIADQLLAEVRAQAKEEIL